MSEIFIIKDTGKGVISELDPEKVVPIGSSQGGGKTGDYIPLTGTEEGKPVTGDLNFGSIAYEDRKLFGFNAQGKEYGLKLGYNTGFYGENSEGYSGLIGLDGRAAPFMNFYGEGYNNYITISEESVIIESNNPLFKGIYTGQDFSDIDPENKKIYAQRSYVDRANSYSTEETKTGGTWINGKPIYTITQLTADTPPTMETAFPAEVIGTYTVYKYTKP